MTRRLSVQRRSCVLNKTRVELPDQAGMPRVQARSRSVRCACGSNTNYHLYHFSRGLIRQLNGKLIPRQVGWAVTVICDGEARQKVGGGTTNQSGVWPIAWNNSTFFCKQSISLTPRPRSLSLFLSQFLVLYNVGCQYIPNFYISSV